MSGGAAPIEKDLEAQRGGDTAGKHNETPSGGPGDSLGPLRTFQGLVGIRTSDEELRPLGPSNPSNPRPISTWTASTTHSMNKPAQESNETPPAATGRSIKKRTLSHYLKLFFTTSRRNHGVYGRAKDEELIAYVWFIISTVCINFIYILQIFVAATITGVASYHGHEIPLTVLGAINTILAGLLAYVKGQGLPNRMLKARDQYQAISKKIEDTERKFAYYDTLPVETKVTLDPLKEAELIMNMFDAAKSDQQDNYPDIYVNNHERAAETAVNENNRVMNAYLPQSNADMAQRIKDLEQQLRVAMHATGQRVPPAMSESNPHGTQGAASDSQTTRAGPSTHSAVTG